MRSGWCLCILYVNRSVSNFHPQFGCLCEQYGMTMKGWQACGESMLKPETENISPDVHGLDSIRQLVHIALILQGSQHDDGGVSRSWGVLLRGDCSLRPHVGPCKHTVTFKSCFSGKFNGEYFKARDRDFPAPWLIYWFDL